MRMKQKLFSILALLLMAATGAWAQTETLLTTITATAKTTYSETTAGVVTVTPSGQAGYSPMYGWLWGNMPGSVTVEAKEGYTITQCVFKQNDKTPVTITTSPFAITFANGICVEDAKKFMNGVTSIEVYGYAPAPTGYNITLDEGTGNKDSQNWEITPQSSELSGNEAVTVKYNGSREVKSVTVVKKAAAPAPANTYLAWDGTQKKLVATPMPESFTTVTSEVSEWSAGTYVVEGEVDITSTIELSGDVNLIIKDGAKLTVANLYGNSHNLSIYGQAQMTGELDVYNSYSDAINEIPTLEVHSAKVTATSSSEYGAGFFEIGTFNVYGGSVDAKGTAEEGGCGIVLSENGSMNIYGGEVKAEGKGIDSDSYGITCGESLETTVKVYGGKLWAGCADNKALDLDGIHLTKDNGFSGKIETSDDNVSWNEYDDIAGTLDHKYVRVGY